MVKILINPKQICWETWFQIYINLNLKKIKKATNSKFKYSPVVLK